MTKKRIIFATLRPNKGATGGPGGVLFLLKYIIGKKFSNYVCSYYFLPTQKSFRGYNKYVNKIIFIFKFISHPFAYYIVHDIVTAKLLSRLHLSYSLVYHQQGPIVQEGINFGEIYEKSDIHYWQRVERLAFIGAKSVHFPSKGAEVMYFNNVYASCKRSEIKLGNPLYNTILEGPIDYSFDLKKDENVLTFFSLGSITKAKGQDQSIKFLEELLHRTDEKIRYIIVGSGIMTKPLIDECEKIKKTFSNFSYCYFSSLPHQKIMYIHSITDVYLMMHRVSIFDFASLEAMNQNSVLILSNVGGNVDFNKDDNIILVENLQQGVEDFLKADLDTLKKKNRIVFEREFSNEAFKRRYFDIIKNNTIK